jgi:hypothetical protein
MHYAPNVSNEDVGGTKLGPHNPYPSIIRQGPHGFITQDFGKLVTAAITKEYREMLASLCQMKQAWCLPDSNGS